MGTTAGFFPFRLGRQTFSPVLTVGLGIVPVHSDHRLFRLIHAGIVPIGGSRMICRPDEITVVLIRDLVLVDEVGIQEDHVRWAFVLKCLC